MKSQTKPTLIVIAGPNGSGKTSITGKILRHEWVENCLYINPDNIAQEKYGDWNSREAIFQAVNFAQTLREEALKNGIGLIFETVLSSEEKFEFINQAKRAGYFIRIFFVGTESPTINAGRVALRVMNGGHDVPINKIISRYTKSISYCAVLSQIADRIYVYDNSIDYEEPKLLFRSVSGKLEKVYTVINDWAKPIYNTLK